MAARTTMASVLLGKTGSKELCSLCQVRPSTVTCSCGAKFDYHCIGQHVNDMDLQIEEQHRQVRSKLNQINELQSRGNDDFDAPVALINNWVCIQ